jgi:sirohydrochlorin cobaltochelatase
MKKGLILLAHGSRDPMWSAPIRAIADRIRARDPSISVGLAFLEFTLPAFPEAVATMIADGIDAIDVAPLFLGQGGHLKRDVTALIDAARAAHPGASMTALPALGESAEMVEAIARWLSKGGKEKREEGRGKGQG